MASVTTLEAQLAVSEIRQPKRMTRPAASGGGGHGGTVWPLPAKAIAPLDTTSPRALSCSLFTPAWVRRERSRSCPRSRSRSRHDGRCTCFGQHGPLCPRPAVDADAGREHRIADQPAGNDHAVADDAVDGKACPVTVVVHELGRGCDGTLVRTGHRSLLSCAARWSLARALTAQPPPTVRQSAL